VREMWSFASGRPVVLLILRDAPERIRRGAVYAELLHWLRFSPGVCFQFLHKMRSAYRAD
jgi:hypothetical protein